MGLFSGIKNTYKKSEAAVVVQNLLDELKQMGLLDSDPAKVANKLVDAAWESRPDIFNGTYGDRPHKVSFAAYSFAYAIGNLRRDSATRATLSIPFGKLMMSIQQTGHLFPFNRLDHELLGGATRLFEELMKDMSDDPLGSDVPLMGETGSAEKATTPPAVTPPAPKQRTWSEQTIQACLNKLFEEGFHPEVVDGGFSVKKAGEKTKNFATRKDLDSFLEATFGMPA